MFFILSLISVRIDWDTEVNKISTDNLVIAEVGDEIRHSFVRFKKKASYLKKISNFKFY